MNKAPEAVSPESVARIEASQSREKSATNAVGNLLAAIDNGVAGAIAETRGERDGLVRRVLELNQKLARLETHELVGGEDAAA